MQPMMRVEQINRAKILQDGDTTADRIALVGNLVHKEI